MSWPGALKTWLGRWGKALVWSGLVLGCVVAWGLILRDPRPEPVPEPVTVPYTVNMINTEAARADMVACNVIGKQLTCFDMDEMLEMYEDVKAKHRSDL